MELCKSKTKHREVIGDLAIKDTKKQILTHSKDKAPALCDFFSSVFPN